MTSEQKPFELPILLDDEPAIDAVLFDFEKNAEDLADIVSIDRNSPFAILLNGEWGSGKTTLMKITKHNLENMESMKAVKIIWFDAWQYEGFDPRSALFTRIIQEFKNEPLSKLTGIIKKLPSFDFGINLGLISVSSSSDKLIEQYVENIDKINNLHSYLEKEIIKDKLVVFIDDLDRCSIENTLNILESIKIFLSIKNTTFIVGADIDKLEKAWELRYNKSMIRFDESKNHIDKIFQINIKLPTKVNSKMYEFLDSFTKDNSFFTTLVKDIIVNGCNPNPRSFKRILNLLHILSFLDKKYGVSQNHNKAILTSVAIMSIQYPLLLHYVRQDPRIFFVLTLLAANYETHNELKKYERELQEINYGNVDRSQSPLQIKTKTKFFSLNKLTSDVIEALKFLAKDKYAFSLMNTIGIQCYNYHGVGEDRLDRIETERRNELQELETIINSSSLFL